MAAPLVGYRASFAGVATVISPVPAQMEVSDSRATVKCRPQGVARKAPAARPQPFGVIFGRDHKGGHVWVRLHGPQQRAARRPMTQTKGGQISILKPSSWVEWITWLTGEILAFFVSEPSPQIVSPEPERTYENVPQVGDSQERPTCTLCGAKGTWPAPGPPISMALYEDGKWRCSNCCKGNDGHIRPVHTMTQEGWPAALPRLPLIRSMDPDDFD